MDELQIKAADQNVPAETLSGGNQQKLVLGKWLADHTRHLLRAARAAVHLRPHPRNACGGLAGEVQGKTATQEKILELALPDAK